MRLVFLLKAEEHGLLPRGTSGCSSGLLALLERLERVHRRTPEALEHSTAAHAWLLGAVRHLPEGGLRDARSPPLLERLESLPMRDSVLRDLLRGLKCARGGRGALQWIDYRTLEVEQLGHLYEGLLDYAVKREPQEQRVLVRRGGMSVGLGGERRAQGAHYTPPVLTELIVREALEAVLPEHDRRKPEALLSLAICDPSMGSGAFLVQVVRVLGGWLADAWEALLSARDGPRTVAVGPGDELLLPSTREARVLLARGCVAERCVYGVDRSVLAVEMARWSLWLVTAGSDRSLSFLDRALVKGDSLLALQWARAFPEVFGARGGFDILVGNPPWGGKLSEPEKRRIDTEFSLVGDYETAHAFFERGCGLVRPGGHLALVLPDTVLRNDSASRLRAHVARRLDLRRVIDLSEGAVFKDASVRCCVIHVDLRAPTEAPVAWSRAEANPRGLAALPVVGLPKDGLPTLEPWTRLPTRLESPGATGAPRPQPPLGEFFEVRQGYIPYRLSTLIERFGAAEGTRIRDERAWHASSKVDEAFVRELQGGDLKPLGLSWSGTWVRYGRWVSTYLEPRYFSGTRVLVREIVGKAPYFVIAAATDAEYVHNPSILVLKPKPGRECLVPLLVVYLNSRWAGAWLRTHGRKADKGLFPKVLVKDLRALPFVSPAVCSDEVLETAGALASTGQGGVDRQAIDAFVERLVDSSCLPPS